MEINHRVIRVEIHPRQIQQRLILEMLVFVRGIARHGLSVFPVSMVAQFGITAIFRESVTEIGLEHQRLIQIKNRSQQHESVAQVELINSSLT